MIVILELNYKECLALSNLCSVGFPESGSISENTKYEKVILYGCTERLSAILVPL